MAALVAHDAQRVAAVRRFNRFYTQHLGVLQDGWLQSPFTLAEARVLYEMHQRGFTTATDIGRALGLDPGYLSRILRRVHKLGLIRKAVSLNNVPCVVRTTITREAFQTAVIAGIGEEMARHPQDPYQALAALIAEEEAVDKGSKKAGSNAGRH